MKTALLTFLRSHRSLWLIPVCAGLFLILATVLFRKPLNIRQARNWDQMRQNLTGETNHETEKMIQYYYQPDPNLTWGGNPTNTPICK
jgi:hypothetical protein